MQLVRCCPTKGLERVILAAGDTHLTLLGLYQDSSLHEVTDLKGKLSHDGAVDAVAWAPSTSVLASAGGGRLGIHRMMTEGVSSDLLAIPLPSSERVSSLCFLGQDSTVATAGEDGRCHIFNLNFLRADAGGESGKPSPLALDRSLTLRSSPVALRTNELEPHQLMVAEDEGHVHFIDLRVPSARPSLTRSLPPSFGAFDAGGLADADWSRHDSYLLGGVCGSQFVGWDLRQPGLNPPPVVGEGPAGGGTAFRWSPHRADFATAGATNEVRLWVQSAQTMSKSAKGDGRSEGGDGEVGNKMRD